MFRFTTFAIAAGLALTIAASAIAAQPAPVPSPAPPSALARTSLLWCGDVVTPRADPELYGDEPIYVSNEMPTGRVQRWARSKPGFVMLWIDRENNGWINVTFTRGVEKRQAELEREFPGVGVVAVKVENSRRTLRRLDRRIGRFVSDRGIDAAWGSGNADNIVQLSVGVLTDDLARALDRRFGGEPLCVSGADRADSVQPGPQPLAGDGWRMLAWEQGQGPTHEVGIASDEDAYASLWQRTGLPGSRAPVDFGSEVVVWFAIGHGSSCPNQRMDEVIVDHARGHIYPLIVDTDNSMACTDDLVGAYQFVAALERSELPAGPFEIGLSGGGDDLFRGQSIVADLSAPWSVASAADVAETRSIPRSGTFQEPFGRFQYAMDVSCGVGYLGVINDVHWVTSEIEMPAVWADAVGVDEELEVTVRLRTRPEPNVSVSLAGETIRYEPASNAPAGCDAEPASEAPHHG